MSALSFAITNKQMLDKSFRVYLRYYFKNEQGKKKLKHFPTDYSLNQNDFLKLKSNTLGGNVNKELQKEKQKLQQIIDDIQAEKGTTDATDKEILNRLNSNHIVYHTPKQYFDLMLNHSVKSKTTIQQYTAMFNRFNEWLNLQKDYINVKSLNQRLFDRYVNYLYNTQQAKQKSAYSINNNARLIKQLLTFIFQQIEVNQTISYKSITAPKQDIYLTENEINQLVNHKTNNRTLQAMQLYIQINRYIGLRRSELIHLKNENVKHHKEYSTLKFYESKKHQYRTITIVNSEVIKLLKKHQTTNEYFFNLKVLNKANINIVLQQLAKACELNRIVTITELKNKQRIMFEKPLNEIIHTHQIRAFAIQYNLMKYGSIITKAYSGHTSVTTIEKHYSHQLNEQEQLQMLLNKEQG